MSTLSESSQDSLGWVYPQPPVEFISVPIADQRGTTQLVSGQEYIDVVFHGSQTNTNWILIACEIVNTTDLTPLNIATGIITSRSLSGFRVQLEGIPDTSNYFLHWAINGTVVPPTPATTYSLTGSSSGHIGAGATFVVELLPDTVVADAVTVTPSDGGGGGVFTPTSVEITSGDPSATFTYTPGLYGSKTISVTNDGGLIDPSSVAFTSTASTYTLSGPSSGTSGVASTDFTVALPVSGVVAGTVTVTPSDGGGGGTFTPTTATLTTAAPSDTFTYTAASTGVKTISVTNNGGLTNPGNLSYTVTGIAVSDTFTDTNGVTLPAHTMDLGSGWTRYEGSGANQMVIQSNAVKSYFDAGSAYGYWTESTFADCTVAFKTIFGVADLFHYCALVFRYSDASNYWYLNVAGSGAGNVTLIKKVAGADTTVDTDTFAITGMVQYDFSVTLSGTSISASAGGTVVSTTDAFNQTATKHGIRTYEGGGASPNYFDNFTVTG